MNTANLHRMQPDQVIEFMEEGDCTCHECHFNQRMGVGRIYKCIEEMPDYPNATASICDKWKLRQSAGVCR